MRDSSLRSAISMSKVPCPLSILRSQHCVVRLFARRHQTGRCKIFLRDSGGCKRDKLAASGEEIWLRGLDLNQRPSGYEPDELPGCSTPRFENSFDVESVQSKNVCASGS